MPLFIQIDASCSLLSKPIMIEIFLQKTLYCKLVKKKKSRHHMLIQIYTCTYLMPVIKCERIFFLEKLICAVLLYKNGNIK